MNTIYTSGKRFVDDKGRHRVFSGINYVYKGVAEDENGVIHYKNELTDGVLSSLSKKGVNVIRLGFTWAGVEPEMTRYNLVYLNEIKDVIKRCEKHGIYVFLDLHQDLFSYFCYRHGDGAPKWASVYSKNPRKPLFVWAEGYFFDRNVMKCFDAFWQNAEVHGRGLRDRFCDMLRFTVKYFEDCGNVFGYDVFNEPYPGSAGGRIFRKIVADGVLTLALSKNVDRKRAIKQLLDRDVMGALGVLDDRAVYHGFIDGAQRALNRFDTGVYYDFMKACSEAVRSVTDRGVIFMENSYYSNLGIPCATPAVVYGDGEREKNLAFAPHGYDLTVDTPLTNKASPHRVDFIFDEHKRKQEKMNVPVLVGEWGGMVPGDGEYPALEHLIDKFDGNMWSQTYWHYIGDMADTKIMDILCRPYPQAVAGEIKKYRYDRKNRVFDLSYTGSADIRVPTVIYLPEKPKKIYSTKKYTLKNNDGFFVLQVNAGKGECAVKVEF